MRGSALRLPIAPPEHPPLEDDSHAAREWAAGFCDSTADDLSRVERLLERWMLRLERRLERLSEAGPCAWGSSWEGRKLPDPLAQARPQPVCVQPRRSQAGPPDRAGSPDAGAPGPTTVGPAHVAEDGLEKSSDGALKSGSMPAVSKTMSEWIMDVGMPIRLSSKRSPKLQRAGTEDRIERHWSAIKKQDGVSSKGDSCACRIVAHEYFDLAITLVVIFNAIMVGVQVDWEARYGDQGGRVFDYIEYGCTGIFSAELFLRLVAMGMGKLCAPGERGMFSVDLMLVMVSWADIVLSMVVNMAGIGTSAFIGKMIKVVRIGRLMRILRTVRLLGELRVMASMIWNSFRSLMWLMAILVALGYCFALVLTQGASMYLSSSESAELSQDGRRAMEVAYGNILLTMYSLFKSMTGGRNWGEVADLISAAGWVYSAVVALYIFLNLFSILNIVTGVFVDGAIEFGKRDRNMMIQKLGKEREASAHHLISLLREMDSSGDGFLTREEFLASAGRHEVKEFMDALAINLDDATNIFSLLDRNMDGMVDVVEFVQGMEKLRGEAKSSDIHMLIMQCQHILDMASRIEGLPQRMRGATGFLDAEFKGTLSDRSCRSQNLTSR